MRRTTISLPEELADALEREARRRHVPVSRVVREAIEARLGAHADRRKLSFVGIGRSGHRTTARDMEEIMTSEWTLDRGR
ncbi:MAG TPA: CopG family transcriptional regulator [Vicinamibacterales bacterium]|nr:CopG family transcriptional regulator [Vicinamibacterales bacterium]